MNESARFVVGETLVTASLDGTELADADKLMMSDGDGTWLVPADLLEASYTPVSETAQHWYNTVVNTDAEE